MENIIGKNKEIFILFYMVLCLIISHFLTIPYFYPFGLFFIVLSSIFHGVIFYRITAIPVQVAVIFSLATIWE
jgi:hypothetical protein